MAKVQVIKSRHIMKQTSVSDKMVSYIDDVDERKVPTKLLSIDKLDWERMGEPHLITVTIQPGDTLNDGTEGDDTVTDLEELAH